MWMTFLDQLLRQAVRQGTLIVHPPTGSPSRYGDGTGQPVTVRINDPSLPRRIMLNPDLGIGEGYMDGTFTIDGDDLHGFLRLAILNSANAWKHPLHRMLWKLRYLARVTRQYNPARRARARVAHHYDLSGELYDLFLDADKQYSCAYFHSETDTLEQAQAQKKAHIAKKLLIEPGMNVLDIGCGWGGLGLTLARDHGARVLGVTLSEEQHRVASERARAAGLSDRARFQLMDYREVEGRFDRVVSVGMFEHVGPKNYNTYFEVVDRNLKPDGLFLLHTIGSKKTDHNVDPWINKYIFPNGCLPSVRQIAEASESHFVMEDWHNFGADYDTTLMAWHERFINAWPEIAGNYNERFKRMFSYYLNACAGAFRARDIQLWQVVFTRGVENGLRVPR